MSRLPVRGDAACHDEVTMGWMHVETPEGPLTIAAIHLSWPYPFPQARQARLAAEALQDVKGPLFVAGDFNAMPWSHAVATIAEASRTRLVPGFRPSFENVPVWPGLSIDHVLADPSIPVHVALGPFSGSDHRALIARLDYGHPPAEAPIFTASRQ